MQTIGIVLAAGKSSRLGRDKLSVVMPDGRTLAAWTLEATLNSCLDQIICVVKPEDTLEWLPIELLRISADTYNPESRLRIALCREYAEGMANSLHCGILTAMEYRPKAVLMLLADQPLITTEEINCIAAVLGANPLCDYVAGTDDEGGKPPVAFRSHLFGPLLSLHGDEGARKLLRDPKYHGVQVPLPQEIFWDADTEPQVQRIIHYAEERMWKEA